MAVTKFPWYCIELVCSNFQVEMNECTLSSPTVVGIDFTNKLNHTFHPDSLLNFI